MSQTVSERARFLPFGVTDPRGREAWVVSACALARQGLVAALHDVQPPYRITAALTGLESARALSAVLRARAPDVIILWLPGDAARQRVMVRLLAATLRMATSVPEIIVLGEGPLYWFYLTLLREARQPSLADALRLLDARHTVRSLLQHLARPWGIPLMKMRFASVRRAVPAYDLSPGELRALEGSLTGVTMEVLGARLGLSPKTLYAQRYRALEKLGFEPPAGDFWLWHLAWLLIDCRGIPEREGP